MSSVSKKPLICDAFTYCFYADDLLKLSRSKLGLQNCLNVLSSYCNSWMLRINPKKTKIMIFQRCTRKCEHNFRIGNEVIDVVQNYTYLGTRITSSGNFTLSLEHLLQKSSSCALQPQAAHGFEWS